MKRLLLLGLLMLFFTTYITAQRSHDKSNTATTNRTFDTQADKNFAGKANKAPAGPEISVDPESFELNILSGEQKNRFLTIFNSSDEYTLNASFVVVDAVKKANSKNSKFGKALEKALNIKERKDFEGKPEFPAFSGETLKASKASVYSTVYSNNFESGISGWYTETYSGSDLWHVSDLNSVSTSHSLWCGIEGDTDYYTGSRVNTAIISPTINLPGVTDEILIDFWEIFNTESGWDYCMVDISTDDGASWTHLRGSASANTAPNGSSGGWVNTTIDITAYKGQNVRFRLYFDTKDGANNSYSGWFVDDFTIKSDNGWVEAAVSEVSVPPGQSEIVKLTFDAAGLNEGTYEAIFRIYSNDPINSPVDIPLTMHVTGEPEASVSEDNLDFGSVQLETEETLPLQIFNTGTADLEITEIKTNNPEFYADKNTLTIPPGGSEILNVSFYAETAGTFDSELSFKTNSGSQATFIIPLHAEIITYNLALNVSPANSGLTEGAGVYQEGDPVKVKAKASEGFIFVNWTDAQGNELSNFETYTFTMPDNNLSLTANFTDKIPQISVNPQAYEESLNAGEMLTRTLTVSNTDNGESTLTGNILMKDPVSKEKAKGKIIKGEVTSQECLVPTNNTIKPKVKLPKLATKEKAGIQGSVLYVNTLENEDTDFQTIISNLPNVSSFETFNGRSGTPDVSFLLNYKVVIVASNFGFSNPELLGNNLAAYADQEGKVIILNGTLSQGGGWALAGDIMQAGYSPLSTASYSGFWVNSVSFISHPITEGVSNIGTALFSHNTIQSPGQSFGTYDAGYPVGAYNPDKPIISLNIFPLNGSWSGDLEQLMQNSIDWLLTFTSWLSIDNSDISLAAGETQEYELTFDASKLNEGTYNKIIEFQTNDPENPVVQIPAVLHVTGFPEIELSSSKLDFGQAMLSTEKTMQLEISNPGSATLSLTNIQSSVPAFYADTDELNIPPGETKTLNVAFYSDESGVFEGKLSFKTNAEDPVFVEVALQAKITTYEIAATASPETSGNITGEGTYHKNEEVTLTATANTGYEFSHWQDGANKLYDNPLVFDATEDKNITAVFSEIPYEITVLVNMTEAGTTDGQGTYLEGETVTLTATAYDNYQFVNWTEDGTEVSADEEYIFTAAEDRELTANFEEQPTFNVTFNVDMNAAVGFDPLTDDVYVSGATQDGSEGFNENFGTWPVLDNNLMLSDNNADGIYTLTLADVKANDYYFNYYFNDAGTQDWETIGLREMSVIDQDVVLNNVWNDKPGYTVNFSTVGTDGTLTAEVDGGQIVDGATVAEGKNVEFIAVPNAGYRVKEWTYNTSPVADNTSETYTVANLGEAINVTVEFEIIPYYTVNFSVVSGSGSITAKADGVSIADGDNVAGRSELVFKASPGTNNRVSQWTHNGTTVENNVSNSYTISSLEGAADVTVKFETIPSYQVNFAVNGGNGTLNASVNEENISSGDNVYEGSDVRFVAMPDEKYRVKEWVYNSSPISGLKNTKYTLYSIGETADISVEFEKYLHLLTFNVSDGSNSIEGAQISVGIKDLTTDAQGSAETDMQNGQYSYTISHDEYLSESGEITIADADESVDIVLEAATDVEDLAYAIEIFPNPSEGKVYIFSSKKLNLQVIDLTGKILDNRIFTGKTELNLTTSGMYFLKFTDEKGSRIEKIIIQ
jgi:hypothetical protein